MRRAETDTSTRLRFDSIRFDSCAFKNSREAEKQMKQVSHFAEKSRLIIVAEVIRTCVKKSV